MDYSVSNKRHTVRRQELDNFKRPHYLVSSDMLDDPGNWIYSWL
jgi:hypothetical protein